MVVLLSASSRLQNHPLIGLGFEQPSFHFYVSTQFALPQSHRMKGPSVKEIALVETVLLLF